jgi:hypothetical protein
MARTTPRSGQVRRRFGRAVLALALATVIGGAGMAAARADDNEGRRQGNDNHRQGNDGRRQGQAAHRGYDRGQEQHRSYRYAAPANVYAPPPVYYAPPSGPPVIDFVFPLSFR